MPDTAFTKDSLLTLTADIVAAHVSHNQCFGE
jgi:predicted transcriptional regulator